MANEVKVNGGIGFTGLLAIVGVLLLVWIFANMFD